MPRSRAGAFQHLTGEGLTIPEDDKGSRRLPEPEKFPPRVLGFGQKGLIPGEEIGGLSVGQVNELHAERVSQSGGQANYDGKLAPMRTA